MTTTSSRCDRIIALIDDRLAGYHSQFSVSPDGPDATSQPNPAQYSSNQVDAPQVYGRLIGQHATA